MIAWFFIDRPIFACVISMFIVLFGAVALRLLPVAQYPPIAPPTVQVVANYPGANARVVADTVAAPIEQQVNGVDGMLYISSQCGSDGSYRLTVTFDLGTDLDTALVLVQNRVALAMPQLPEAIQQQGIALRKKSPNVLLMVSLFSPDGRYDDIYLSNYATIHIRDVLLRLDGVGDIVTFGQRDYSIRAWLDPQAMAARSITASDVIDAIQHQNVDDAPGMLGAAPFNAAVPLALPIAVNGPLDDPEDFAQIVIRSEPGGVAPSLVRLGDVARLELGAAKYDQSASVDGKPAVGLAIFQLPGSNALDVADRVRAAMDDLRRSFPEGLDYTIAYDTTPYIRDSVLDVVITLLIAVVLVAIVVTLFLQSWRAVIVPLAAIPVAIVGTFAVMAAFGFSLNNISLFGLVLAIGIVVDDAIVVVENVERWLARGLSPREAARRAMTEVTGPIVAVAVVLCAVFVPCALISGIPGQLFRQFALTIATSTVISAFNSLTLSPALAAVLLRPPSARPPGLIRRVLRAPFTLFNRSLEGLTALYGRTVSTAVRGAVVVFAIYVLLLFAAQRLSQHVPRGFVPVQDQGWLLVNIALPAGASLERTEATVARAGEIIRSTPGVAHTVAISGFSLLMMAGQANQGSMFVILDPFDERRTPGLTAEAIAASLQSTIDRDLPGAQTHVLGAPPIPGLGLAAGFSLEVEDRGSLGAEALARTTNAIIQRAIASGGFRTALTLFRADAPEIGLEIDSTRVRSLGVTARDVDLSLQTFLGGIFVDTFNAFGRSWQVYAQADERFRRRPEDIGLIQVRNDRGEMVPLSTLTVAREIDAPPLVLRYNLFEAAPIIAVPAVGTSAGQAMALMNAAAEAELPLAMAAEWTDLMYMQIRAGNTALMVFGVAALLVFLSLAALYESWSLPFAVVLVVPLCILSALAGVALRGLPADLFVEIGFVVLIGLASKNAILIVEFARQLMREGRSPRDAAVEASRLRLRPILMTSLAFILGVFPMVIARGAGAELRQSLGTAVFAGMIGVTVIGLLLTPVCFATIEQAARWRPMRTPAARGVLSAVLGVGGGLSLGALAAAAGLGPTRWLLVAGAALGLIAAVLVARRTRAQLDREEVVRHDPHPTRPERPSMDDPVRH